MVEERKLEMPRRPIFWDPVPPWIILWDPAPPWVELDDKLQRQFAQMELKFMKMELELQQQKTAGVRKDLGNSQELALGKGGGTASMLESYPPRSHVRQALG